MGIPQWTILAWLALQIGGAPLIHGKPRKNPYWNGIDTGLTGILFLTLLAWGGFFGKLS